MSLLSDQNKLGDKTLTGWSHYQVQESPDELENLSEEDVQPRCVMVRTWFSLLRTAKGIPLHMSISFIVCIYLVTINCNV